MQATQPAELTFHEKTALGFARRADAAKNQADADWNMRHALRHAERAGLSLQAIEAKAAALEAPASCSVKAIRRFFAICKNARIDASNDDRVRGALSVFFGKRINSRKELSTDMWLSAGDAIEAGRLVF